MRRGIIIMLLIVIVSFLAFEMCDRDIVAQDIEGIGRVLENQKLILQKLNTLDKKINQLKMRIKI